MRPIDADKLKKEVLKWMPSDPCGIEEKEFPFETDIVVSLMMEIEEAPTIEQPTWIPCSERLPNKNDEYIITMGKDGFNKEGYVTWAMFDKLEKKFYFPGGRVNYYIAVTAWMPKPEPWKGINNE